MLLRGYPFIQPAVAITVLLGALYFVMHATSDKLPPLPPRKPVPQGIMMGPMHDTMQSVHEVAEEAQQTLELIRDGKSDEIEEPPLAGWLNGGPGWTRELGSRPALPPLWPDDLKRGLMLRPEVTESPP